MALTEISHFSPTLCARHLLELMRRGAITSKMFEDNFKLSILDEDERSSLFEQEIERDPIIVKRAIITLLGSLKT